MNELSNILKARIKITRLNPFVVERRGITPTLPIGAQPTRTSRIVIDVAGATIGAGAVTVAGNTTESFAFVADGFCVGLLDFTSISSITVNGLSDGFIAVKAVSRSGQPVNNEKTIYESLPVYFFAASGKIKISPAGQAKAAKYKIIAGPYSDIREKDMIYAVSGIDGLTFGRVSFVEGIRDLAGITQTIQAEISDA